MQDVSHTVEIKKDLSALEAATRKPLLGLFSGRNPPMQTEAVAAVVVNTFGRKDPKRLK